MKRFSGKYDRLCEETLYRYQTNGFLGGDYVVIKKDALSHPKIEDMSQPVKDMIKNLMKNETVLRISYIKSARSEAPSGPVGAPNVPGCIWADVITEYAPGMWKDPMTLPIDILEKVEKESDAEGYIKYSKSLVRPNDNSDTGAKSDEQTKVTDSNRNLTTKNTKLANTKSPKDGRDDLEALKESEKTMKQLRENDIIFERYVKHLREDLTPTNNVSAATNTVSDGGTVAGADENVESVLNDPAALADKFSAIKKAKGPDALTALVSNLIKNGHKEAVSAAIKYKMAQQPTSTGTPEGVTSNPNTEAGISDEDAGRTSLPKNEDELNPSVEDKY